MPSFNEHFCENMVGKKIKYDIQPYEHGEGTITKMTPRWVERTEFNPNRGRTKIGYEVFDVTVKLETGTKIGALICGVPVRGTIHNIAGQETCVTSCTYGEIYRSINEGVTIIHTTCG